MEKKKEEREELIKVVKQGAAGGRQAVSDRGV